MRHLVFFVVALLGTVLATRSASATAICDPAGHFCIQVDTTSATTCTPLRPGGWTPATCQASDGEARKYAKAVDEATHGAVHVVDALIARFDDMTTTVMLYRRAAQPEVGGDAGARDAMRAWTEHLAQARPAGWLAEDVQPPTLSRVNGVQVARLETRLSSAGIGGAIFSRDIAYEVRTRDAAYLVTFEAEDVNAARLSAMADGSMATLDALRVESATGAGDALVWLLRGVVAAVVLVGLGWLVNRRKGRRSGIDSRDLWPR
jgi:hypothetical protein